MHDRQSRQEQIRHLLAEQGRLSIHALATRLGVAPMTIRRDLQALEAAGVLTRTHGGCVPHSPFVEELSFLSRLRLRQPEKAAIAVAAVRLLKRGQALYLDTGTTALQVARVLPLDLELRLFTNNLRVALELLGRGLPVVVYGGALASRSPDLGGELALAHLHEFRLDVAIVGADALDPLHGEFYGADTEAAVLCRAAQRQAARVLVVLDSSKIGKRGLAVAGRLGPGIVVITDDEMGRAERAAVRRTGATLVCASARKTVRGKPERGGGP